MGISDAYCFITGCKYLSHRHEVRNGIMFDCLPNLPSAYLRDESSIGDALEELSVSEDDMKAANDFVMLCPCTRRATRDVHLHCGITAKVPRHVSRDNIAITFNVFSSHERGLYRNAGDNASEYDPLYWVTQRSLTMLITHSSYLILLKAAPRLLPHIIYKIKYRVKPTLDYGPMNGIQTVQYAYWPGLAHSDHWDESQTCEAFWESLLSRANIMNEETRLEAWRGAGNMWALVRPDRFPIAKTEEEPMISPPITHKLAFSSFERIPPDIIFHLGEMIHPRTLRSLASTSRRMYHGLKPRMHQIVYKYMVHSEPWYLPGGPFDVPNGDREIVWWNTQWCDRGLLADDRRDTIPWLCYRRACSHSMSMWNRIRIWMVIKQTEKVAEREELISS